MVKQAFKWLIFFIFKHFFDKVEKHLKIKEVSMKIINNNSKTFSPEWFKNLTIKSEIKHGSMFEAVFVNKNDDPNAKTKYSPFGRKYIFFNGEYYKLTSDGSEKVDKDDPIMTQNSLNTVVAYDLNEEELSFPAKYYIEEIKKIFIEEEMKYELSEEDKSVLNKYNIVPCPVMGATSSLKKGSAINYDGVQYAICFHYDDLERKEYFISHGVSHFEQIKARHHEKIKSVYDFMMESQDIKHPIWVMIGGKAEIQAFFGNEDGYIAILYLDYDDYNDYGYKNKGIKNKFTMITQNRVNDFIFEDFKNPKIKVVKSRDIYG